MAKVTENGPQSHVLAVHHKAVCRSTTILEHWTGDLFCILSDHREGESKILGTGTTPGKAWADAADRLTAPRDE